MTFPVRIENWILSGMPIFICYCSFFVINIMSKLVLTYHVSLCTLCRKYTETRVRSAVNTNKFPSALNENHINFVYTVIMCKLLNRNFFVNLFIVYFLVLTSLLI